MNCVASTNSEMNQPFNITFKNNEIEIRDNQYMKYLNSNRKNNVTKMMFLFKHQETNNYICNYHAFMLNASSNQHLVGQFISSNWFKERINVKHMLEFMIIEASKQASYDDIEEIVNNREEHELDAIVNTNATSIHNNQDVIIHSLYKFKITPHDLRVHIDEGFDYFNNQYSNLINSNNFLSQREIGFYDFRVKSICNRMNISFNSYFHINNNKNDNQDTYDVDKTQFVISTPQFMI